MTIKDLPKIKTDDEGRDYYMIGERKIYAMECKTDRDRSIQESIMKYRMERVK